MRSDLSGLQGASRSSYNRRQRDQRLKGVLIGGGVFLAIALLIGGVFASQKLISSHAAAPQAQAAAPIKTIAGLQTITQVGSTTDILDANGNAITANPDPYKIAIAPANLGPNLKKGDVLVSNIGNDTKGITIVKFPQGKQGKGTVFNAMPGNGDGILGPSGLVFNNKKLLVANSSGNNVIALNPDGTVSQTIKDPLFNAPWGITVGKGNADNAGLATFFTANKFDGKILRVDLMAAQDGQAAQAKVTQIGQYALVGKVSKIDLHWMKSLKVGNQTLKDVLVTINPANNSIEAFANSSKLQAVAQPTAVFTGTPLNNPGGLALNPLNGDFLVVNLNDNNLVEINPTTGMAVGTKAVDPLVVDGQGNNSALFGVVATTDAQGNLKVFYTDDNTNSLNSLSK